MQKKRTLLLFSLLLPAFLAAQLPTACTGGGQPAISCDLACINCNFNGFTGSTTGFPSGQAPDFCGTVENVQWLGFIAGEAQATFTIIPSGCSYGDGLQVALYADCTAPPLACEHGMEDGGLLPVSISVTLNPGSNYFLLVDGYAGDQCEFTISVSPASAVYEPPLGAAGAISGPTGVCPGSTFAYSVQPAPGAGAYVWSGPPGTLINGEPSPLAVAAPAGLEVMVTHGDAGGELCVQAVNSCNQNAPCTATLSFEILPESERPAIQADSLYHLTCTGAPLKLDVSVTPPAAYHAAWSTDSAGHFASDTNVLQVSVDQLGVYRLAVRNTANGCADTAVVEVGPPEAPAGAELLPRQITCYGFNDGRLAIGPVVGGQPPYLFSLDGSAFSADRDYEKLEPGLHSLTVQAADGCEWDTLLEITQPDELLLFLDPDTTLHLGGAVGLWKDENVNFPHRIAQRLVQPADLYPMLCDTCTYWPTTSFHYAVTVLDSNGCRATDERMVLVDRGRQVFIPNVFAPGAAEGNELFTVGAGPDVEQVLSVRIYNRWGNLVFEQYDLPPQQPGAGWNGSLRGRKAEPAVYVYDVEVKFKDGATERYRGDVTVVR
jgi:gliding motility-associated-like protein